MFDLIIISVGLLICIGIILGVAIGLAAKFFKVHQDPKLELIQEALPGANCGGCGFAGCADFAKALLENKKSAEHCPVCSDVELSKISSILGTSSGFKTVKKVAFVLCGGDREKAEFAANYNGVLDCASASIVSGGVKGCQVGCLGFGSCVRACPFNAIELTAKGLAVVHPELCVGCEKCIRSCPKKIIKMVPSSAQVHILCSSTEKGAVKKKYCSVSCIGCRKCFNNVQNGEIEMSGFLAKINYENPPVKEIVAQSQCPTGCLIDKC